MKKVLAIVLAFVLVFALAACGNKKAEEPAAEEATEEAAEEAEAEEAEAEEAEAEEAAPTEHGEVISYADYVAADLDTLVTVETYVQAKQSWWEDKATVYTQNEDGGIFLYNMACSQEDYDKLVEGQKIKVTGYKSEWSGEVEIVDGFFEILDGNFIAEPVDVTDKLASDDLIDFQNQKVSFTGMTVEPKKDADGNEVAFLYAWDGSGQQGDDLYFDVSKDGQTYTFTVESYLCGADTDVYKTVEGLNVGDSIDMEGFLYWYEGVNPHITAIK